MKSVHPVAAMFPMIPKGSKPWNDLIDSIQNIGQIDPVVYDGDVLLDGRNRLAACEQLGIKAKSVQWSDISINIPIHHWILSKNIDRRHLTDEQRAAIFAEYSTWETAQAGKQKQDAVKFKPGKSGNPTGKAKEQADTKSYPPALDTKEKNANSTVGKIAAAAGVSNHKAAQAVKLVKAAKDNPDAAKALDDVKSGVVPLKDAVKAVENETAKKPTEKPKAWIKVWLSFKRLSRQDQISFVAYYEDHYTQEQGVIEQ